METRRLRVLIVDAEAPVTAAIAAVLMRRGHEVLVARGADDALAVDPPDVLIADQNLGGTSGLDVLATYQARGANPHTVITSSEPNLADCRRALTLGAAEFLSKPFRIEELVRAVERAPRERACPSVHDDTSFERTWVSIPENVARATRAVLALALANGVGPCVRARIGSATCELLDNARRHGYAGGIGPIRVRAGFETAGFFVRVHDQGHGFDAPALLAGGLAGGLAGMRDQGLARAAALCEAFEIESYTGRGTLVTLRFTPWTVDFDEDAHVDLSERDYFTPELARRVLDSLAHERTSDRYHFSPALATSVGRWLTTPNPRAAASKALWS